MLVLADKKALILKVRNPAQIQAVIPTAKPLKVPAGEFLAVPHRLDEVRVLRNLGILAPPPIRHYYEWSGQYTPFLAQRATAEFLTLNPRAFVLSDLGTGKSMAALWAYDYLRSIGMAHSLLVISPLSTLERTWADEVFMHFPHLSYSVLYGSRAKRLKLLERPADVYIVNHDGAQIIAPALATRQDVDVVLIDEIAQVARNAQTARWKVLNTIVNRQIEGRRRAWGLTGTPTPTAPTDAWAQCRLLVPHQVPQYANRFRDQVMRQINQFLWLPRENAMEIVREVMQPSIRFRRDECVDLPPCMHETRDVPLTAEQTAAYKEMMNTLRTQAANGEILAVNEAIKTSKLIQIVCGVAYDRGGNECTIGAQHRIQAVVDIVQEAAAKVIVFVPFVSSTGYVSEALQAQGITTAVVHGGVSKHDRDDIFGRFQADPELRVLVAQPAAMSHGLTLTAANTIVWYAPITQPEVHTQAEGRITRPGQKNAQFIIRLAATALERRMYDRLSKKQSLQGILLDEIEEGREAYV